jgi:hypothetical protein
MNRTSTRQPAATPTARKPVRSARARWVRRLLLVLAVLLPPAVLLAPAVLPSAAVLVAVVVRLVAGAGYLLAVLRGRARPNLVSWSLWALTPMITVVAQVQSGAGIEVAVTVALGLGPLAVCGAMIATGRAVIAPTTSDLLCGASALVGIVAWQLVGDPLLAIGFCIAADLMASVPTVRKSYRDPDSEHPVPYVLSAAAMVITLLATPDRTFESCGFATYILGINLAILSALALAPRGTAGADVRSVTGARRSR